LRCGITGFWEIEGEKREILTDIVVKTTSAFSHRGPDSKGFYVDEKSSIALGHRRLTILDLSERGHQPMEYFSGRYAIIYNGEIYNYKDLSKKIKDNFNIDFKCNSDTGVLLAGFEVWGIEQTLKKINGMFTFALWDKKEKKLYLSRNGIGIKPLYYGVQGKILFILKKPPSLKVVMAKWFYH
jgi:asparagine synthase (glutamine-hydrolysing)